MTHSQKPCNKHNTELHYSLKAYHAEGHASRKAHQGLGSHLLETEGLVSTRHKAICYCYSKLTSCLEPLPPLPPPRPPRRPRPLPLLDSLLDSLVKSSSSMSLSLLPPDASCDAKTGLLEDGYYRRHEAGDRRRERHGLTSSSLSAASSSLSLAERTRLLGVVPCNQSVVKRSCYNATPDL
jgi:hypothetical protein